MRQGSQRLYEGVVIGIMQVGRAQVKRERAAPYFCLREIDFVTKEKLFYVLRPPATSLEKTCSECGANNTGDVATCKRRAVRLCRRALLSTCPEFSVRRVPQGSRIRQRFLVRLRYLPHQELRGNSRSLACEEKEGKDMTVEEKGLISTRPVAHG